MIDTYSLPGGDLAFVSPAELAHSLGVTIDCIYRLAAKRVLPAYRILRRIRFRRSDVERWLSAHKTEARNPKVWR